MARRRSRAARYRTRTRTIYRRSRGGGGSFKPVIDGFLAGIGGQLASKFLGNYGHPVASIAVGMWRNNTTLKTEGARELGAQAATMIPLIGGQSPYGGGAY